MQLVVASKVADIFRNQVQMLEKGQFIATLQIILRSLKYHQTTSFHLKSITLI